MRKISKILAVVLCIAMLMSTTAFAATTDAADKVPLETAASALADAGVAIDAANGDAKVTRAEICTMIVQLMDADGLGLAYSQFADLAGYEAAAPYINYAATEGITNGYGNGKFLPGNNVTFAELVAFVVRAAGYPSPTGSWPQNFIAKANDLGILKGVNVPLNVRSANVSKADAAAVLYNAMALIQDNADYDGKEYVKRDDWDPYVKAALNDFIAAYGKDSVKYSDDAYVVFDFDDTCAIYDVAVAERYYRLQTMQFQFTPEELPQLLNACFGNKDVARAASASYCDDKGNHSYQDWYDDIVAAYTYLWNTYGPFDYKGVTGDKQAKMLADPWWSEFAVKFQVVLKVVNSAEGDYPAYFWYKYWNFGMTEDQGYYVSKCAYEAHKNSPSKSVTWSTSPEIQSKVGTVSTSWTEGISVSPNMVELWKVLNENGIDVWICSASGTTQIRAAVDVLGGGHNYVTGIIAYTSDMQDGQRTPESKTGPELAWSDRWYDWDAGTAWYTTNNYNLYNGWKPAEIPIHSDVVQMGKVTAINNALVSQYGCGPLAAFGDSAGDFEMMTMWDSLKLSMVSNAGKSITSFNLANVALYQRDVLGWDLATANAAGETLFVLQGRNLNGTRSFIADGGLIALGKDAVKALDDGSKAQIDWMKTQGTDIGKIIETLCIKTNADAANNVIGVKYGFRNYYGGYHSLHFGNGTEMDAVKVVDAQKEYVKRDDWDPYVKDALNDFIASYGKDSVAYDGDEYVVFDFDDTCAIYDVAVAERYYRLQTMQFQFTPEELPQLLDACFGSAEVARTASASYCDDKGNHSYQDWFDDIIAAYTYLWNTYGPFDYKGVTGEKQAKMLADPWWSEFAVKFQVVLKVVNSAEGDYPAYFWYKYWNYGMTEDQGYYVSKCAYEAHKNSPSKSVTWSTSPEIQSKVGTVTTSWTEGISVSPNMVELWKALDDNGIDVWICSASGTTQIRAAVDVLGGGHDYVTGIIAYTSDMQDGQRTPESKTGPELAWSDRWYDWDAGTAWYTTDNYDLYNGWKPAEIPIHSDVVQMGKVTAINNALVSQYGCGPLAAFGDSAGDFEMMTMFDSLKLSLVSNAGKSITSFNLANVARYQRDVLGWDLAKANAAGETLFVLQGRDLNGTRSFIAGDGLIGLGKTEPSALDDGSKAQIEWMKTQGTDIGKIIETLCIKTAADSPDNVIGIKYGFRNYYGGYHSLHFGNGNG